MLMLKTERQRCATTELGYIGLDLWPANSKELKPRQRLISCLGCPEAQRRGQGHRSVTTKVDRNQETTA